MITFMVSRLLKQLKRDSILKFVSQIPCYLTKIWPHLKKPSFKNKKEISFSITHPDYEKDDDDEPKKWFKNKC